MFLTRYIVSLLFLFMLIAVVGCQNSEQPKGAKTESTGADVEESTSDSPWVGRWTLVLSQKGIDFHPLLFKVEEMSGQVMIRLAERSAKNPEFQKWNLHSAYFHEDNVFLAITGEEEEEVYMFEGKLLEDEEIVLGAFQKQQELNVNPASLQKTSATSLREIESPVPTPGIEEFVQAVRLDSSVEAVEEFTKNFPNSPNRLQAEAVLLALHVDQKPSLEEMREYVKDYFEISQRWGTRVLLDTYFTCLANLNSDPQYFPLALEKLKEFKNGLNDQEKPEELTSRLEIVTGQTYVNSEDPEQQQEGVNILKGVLEEMPFNLPSLLSLARYYERSEQKEQALTAYSQLAILPGVTQQVQAFMGPSAPSVTEKTKQLWEGSEEEDFEEFLNKAYEEQAFPFVKKEEEEEETTLRDNRKVPLVELFTGASCGPCVAADLALAGVEQNFPAPEAIILRYHQNIPQPDPLTNSATENRAGYYGVRGTPSIFINGDSKVNVAGFLFDAPIVYDYLNQSVGNAIGALSNVTIDLQASVEGDTVKISAKASGVSQSRPKMHLRFLLVEPLVKFPAPNGIRLHEMVVRDMPGGAAGFPINGTEISQEAERSIPQLKADLKNSIEKMESAADFKFSHVPLDLNQLYVVAIVQDDSTRTIFQSAISPLLEISSASSESE